MDTKKVKIKYAPNTVIVHGTVGNIHTMNYKGGQRLWHRKGMYFMDFFNHKKKEIIKSKLN